MAYIFVLLKEGLEALPRVFVWLKEQTELISIHVFQHPDDALVCKVARSEHPSDVMRLRGNYECEHILFPVSLVCALGDFVNVSGVLIISESPQNEVGIFIFQAASPSV